jgi:hypothetical protein
LIVFYGRNQVANFMKADHCSVKVTLFGVLIYILRRHGKTLKNPVPE